MKETIAKLILNIEFTNIDTVRRIEILCTELSLTPSDFVEKAINKLLTDIEFVRSLRTYNKSN